MCWYVVNAWVNGCAYVGFEFLYCVGNIFLECRNVSRILDSLVSTTYLQRLPVISRGIKDRADSDLDRALLDYTLIY